MEGVLIFILVALLVFQSDCFVNRGISASGKAIRVKCGPIGLNNFFSTNRYKVSMRRHDSLRMDNSAEDVDAVVVGSGISGSTAAFYMNKNDLNVVVAEARDYAGGNLISKRGTQVHRAHLCCKATDIEIPFPPSHLLSILHRGRLSVGRGPKLLSA
jgi:hypothetical protein